MEGIKKVMNGQIDDQGTLRLNMVELREMTRQHPNQKVIVTLEIMDGGDVEIMKAWYNNYVLPKVVTAWRELGEYYTIGQADQSLRRHTSTCWEGGRGCLSFDELDRERRKRYLDEVTIYCSTNLNLILG